MMSDRSRYPQQQQQQKPPKVKKHLPSSWRSKYKRTFDQIQMPCEYNERDAVAKMENPVVVVVSHSTR